MALQIIPNIPDKSTSGERYLKDKLSRMYKDRDAILYVKPKTKDFEPDFILIDPLKGVAILEVKDWSKGYILEMNNVNVKTIDGRSLYNPGFRTKQYHNLLKSIFEGETSLINSNTGNLNFNLYPKVLYTNMTNEEIDSYGEILESYPVINVGSDILRSWEIDDIFSLDNIFINSLEMQKLRGILFPEIKVYETENLIKNNSEKIEKVIKVLDFEQENFARRISEGNYMVSGIPGSGKTVILLARALHLLKENPHWKIKIVTYNKSLNTKIESRLLKLKNDLIFNGVNLNNLSITTFHKMALNVAKISVPSYAKDEFWNDELPNKAIERAYPMYDAILIDEYQDFRDNWIELCVKLTKESSDGKKSIFLAGDRLQSIYNPKEIIWKDLGIIIQGRSKLLKHSYRAGKKHIELALEFLRKDRELGEEVNKFYEGAEDIIAESYDEEVKFINDEYGEIANLLETFIFKLDYKPEEILILTPSNYRCTDIYNRLPSSLARVSEVSKNITSDKLVITTYHSSKGLEGKICILVDFDKLDKRKLAYVGMTRAAEKVYIHSNNFDGSNYASEIYDMVNK